MFLYPTFPGKLHRACRLLILRRVAIRTQSVFSKEISAVFALLAYRSLPVLARGIGRMSKDQCTVNLPATVQGSSYNSTNFNLTSHSPVLQHYGVPAQFSSTPIQHHPPPTGSVHQNYAPAAIDAATIVQSLNEIKGELRNFSTKLDTLTNSVSFALGRIDDLALKVDPLITRVKTLEGECSVLQRNNQDFQKVTDHLRKKVADLEAQEKKTNLIFEGIPESCKETTPEIKQIIRRKMLVLADLEIVTYRLPVYGQRNKPRPLMVIFDSTKERNMVWVQRRHLAGSQITLSEDLPKEHRVERKQLLPVFKKAKEMKMKAFLNGNKLQINGRTYTTDTIHQLPNAALHPENLAVRTYGSVVTFFTSAAPLSNFHPCNLMIDGRSYSSVEQFFQYQKAIINKDTFRAQQILQSEDPARCKALGDAVKVENPQLWETRSIQVMTQGCTAKFQQNPNLRKKLLATQDKTLAEGSRHAFWGTGLMLNDPNNGDTNLWKGKNMLGSILQEIRDLSSRMPSQASQEGWV